MCIQCCSKNRDGKKQAALRSLDLNIQPVKRIRRSNGLQPATTSLQPTVSCPQPPLPLNLPVELPLPNPPTTPFELPLPNPPTEPEPPRVLPTVLPPTEPAGFLPTDE
jgi:hypothetical protein